MKTVRAPHLRIYRSATIAYHRAVNASPGCILIVDDDRKSAETLRLFVRSHGFAAVIAYDGESALTLARDEHPDVILLDVMLPIVDGFEVCARLRQFSNAAILMLTAKTFEADRIRGLEGGADDYILKPYSLNEVLARIRAILRRTKPTISPNDRTIAIGGAVIDLRGRSVTISGERVPLTPTHFRLLTCLALSAGTPLSRAELIERVLGWDYDGLDRTIDVHVAGLRKRLAAVSSPGFVITTVFGLGYALEETT
jgi:DNA-binding response OmpR family regulator